MAAFRLYTLIRSGIIVLAFVCLGSWLTFSVFSSSDKAAFSSESGASVVATPISSVNSLPSQDNQANAPASAPTTFFAAVEQKGAGSGEIDLYNLILGSSGSADVFSTASPSTLGVLNSCNEGKPDIDNPTAASFDTNGNLLIANFGTTTGGDYGNLAAVSASAIFGSGNRATTVETFLDSPTALAYDSRDLSVALANNPTGATSGGYDLVQFLPSGNNYTAAPTSRFIHSQLADTAIANVPGTGLTAGTYAAALTNGTDNHNPGGISKVAIIGPTGCEADIGNSQFSTSQIDLPSGLAWDAQNQQLVVSNQSFYTGPGADIAFYTVPASGGCPGTPTLVKSIDPGSAEGNPAYYAVAASPDGHIAAAYISYTSEFQIQVFDNTSARNKVGSYIPYNSTSTPGGNYIYDTGSVNTGPGGTEKIQSMKWLSNTKLMVALTTQAPGKAGYYIYDISSLTVPPGYDDNFQQPFVAAPKQTGFLAAKVVNGQIYFPLDFAFKPVTYADTTGSCGRFTPCYTTISAAIAAQTIAGGLINVSGGTYNENVNLNSNVIVNLNANTTVSDLTISQGTLNIGGGNCGQASGANLTLASGNFTSNGGTFNAGSGTVTLAAGSWVNNGGTFNSGGGTVAFSGSSAQTIGGSNPTTFNNLTINNASGVNLNNSETVGGALTLTNGALDVGSNTLTLNGAASKTSGSLTSAANGTVIYNQSLDGQAVLAANYGNLTFSNFKKILPNGGTVKIAGSFTAGTASGHTLTGSTVEYNGTSAQTLPSAFPTYNNLTLNNSAGTTGFAGLTVQGVTEVKTGTFTSGGTYNNVQIDSGATLAGTNAANINVSGSWTNNGTFTANGNTVNFNGSTAQTIGGTQSTTFNNLLLSNTSGISLGNNISVAATLQVNANVLFNLGAFDVPTVGALVNSGDIRKTQLVSGTGGKTFGLAGSFNGANLTVGVGTQGTLSSLQVDRFDSNHPNATLGQQTGRYWVITPTGTGYSVNLTLPRSNPGAPSACRYTGTGAVWDCDVSSSTANTVTRNNVTTLSPWAVGNNAITPPTIGKAFSAASIQTGGQSTVTLTLSNSNINNLVSGAFTDTLTNMSAVGGAVGGTCSGTAPNTLTAGATALSFSGIIIPANGSCTVTFPVTSTSAGALTNTTSGVTTLQTPTAGTASNTASLTVYTPPSISKAFSPTAIAAGGQSTVTLTLSNSNTTGALTNAALTDTLTNMSAAGGAVGGTCVGTTPTSLSAGSTNLSFTGITIPTNGNCTVTFSVTSTVAGINSNTASGVTSTQTSTAGAASNTANLTVTGAPLIQKSFTPATIGLNGTSVLTITITNPAANTTALTGVGVSDAFPAGMEVDAAPLVTNSCATGTFAPVAAATSISISGATIPVSTACTFTVKVKGTSFGDLVNTTGNVTSSNGGTGLTATATLSVVTLEGDVTPRSSGDGKVDATDVQQIERFAVGFDKPYQSNEGQRADVAPRLDTSNNFVGGDGQVDATDVQQAERYAIGTDPLTPSGGPTTVTAPEPGSPEPIRSEAGKRLETSLLGNILPKNLIDKPEVTPRALSIQNVNTSPGQTVVVNVLANIAGDETRYTFSLSYDQTKLTNPTIPATGPISGETVLSNTNTAGQIGVSIGHGGVAFPAGNGQVLLTVTFTVANNAATGATPINFTNTPAAEATSNAAAQPLATSYTNGTVTINQVTAAPVTVSGRVTDSSGRGIMGATVHITKQNGAILTTGTNSSGYYEFKELEVGETIIINVYAKRYQFETQVVTLTEDLPALNFAPMPGIVKGNDGLKAPQKQEKEEKDELKQP